jgi:choline dehydrogenase-like flavoprotein
VAVTLLDSGQRRAQGLVVKAAGNTVARWTSTRGARTGRDVATVESVEWNSARVHGGLSCFWTGSVPRFAPDDFVDGARVDEAFRWPITYDDLADHYEAVEHIMDVTAGEPLAAVPAPVRRHTQRMSSDWTRICDAVQAGDTGRSMGFMPMAKGSRWMLSRRATEFNSYDELVAPLQHSSQFTLLRGRHVMSLERARVGGPVDTVVVRNRATGAIERHHGVAIVLAAGALDTTEILLRSRSSHHPHGLGNGHGVLGRYLHDHPKQWWRMRVEQPMRALSHPLYLTSRPMAEHAPMRTAGFTLGLGGRQERVRTWYGGSSHALGVLTFATLIPSPEAHVELARDARDPDWSDLRICIRFGDDTHRLLEESQRECVETLRAAGLRCRADFEMPHGAPGSSFHFGGTARMHDRPEYGVVDAENRLHEAPEVLVVDSACFTTGPEKNPTLTAMAIARRAAVRLASSLGESGSTGRTTCAVAH